MLVLTFTARIALQELIKTQVAATSLQGTAVAVHFASASLEGKPHAVFGIAVGATDGETDLEGVLLHWGCVAGRGQDWQQPPAGWYTDPDYSQNDGMHDWCQDMYQIACRISL